MEIILVLIVVVGLIFVYNSLNAKLSEIVVKINYLNTLYESLAKAQREAAKDSVTLSETATAVPQQADSKPNVIPDVRQTPLVVAETRAAAVTPASPVQENTPNILKPAVPNIPTYRAPEKNFDKPLYQPKPSWWKTFKENNPDLEKFIGENIINKIGVLILVLGISYFVKFAIDKDWISEPARVGIGMLVGGLIMFIAHKLRTNYKAFSSVLVAGAIAVFYLTIAIAFHDYHLFNQQVAFIIMVFITAFSAFVSLSYNRVELAVLSLIGGFAVPFMVSTGSGNFVVLFTYVAVLNLGILAIAYYKRWLLLNILAYAFTTILFLSWFVGVINKVNTPYLPALGFAFLFYVIFATMNMINNIKFKSVFSAIQIAVMVANTFIFYGIGMSVFQKFHPELKGVFTAVLAVLNLISAWIIYKKSDHDKNLIYLLIGLSLSFATLAVPVQFSGNYITLFWAAEAVLLTWLAKKSKFASFKLGAIAVHFLMCISLIMDWFGGYASNTNFAVVLNPVFITSVFSVVSIFLVWRLLKDENDETVFKFIPINIKRYRLVLAVVGVLLAYFGGFLETQHQSFKYLESTYAPDSVIALYHLVFSILFIQFFLKKDGIFISLAQVVSVINIFLFVFVFSRYAMYETKSYISYATKGYLAYAIHFVLIACTAYFVYILYRCRNKTKIKSALVIWVAAFVIIYFASFELMLHSMYSALTLPTASEISSFLKRGNGSESKQFVLDMLAAEKIQTLRAFVIKTGYPILWAVLVFIFLIVGIQKKSKHWRLAALVLLGLTVIKLFTYDIRNASETGKIVAFILLGVLILVISFVYQKIKRLVVTDEIEADKEVKNDE